VLLELRTPILFVQGSRDTMCPLPRLAEVRQRMQAPNELHVVAEGDHSLLVSRARLKADQTSQAEVDAGIITTLETFVARFRGP
jgi:alpha-beta hydrolase superfamily lysophospholipase